MNWVDKPVEQNTLLMDIYMNDDGFREFIREYDIDVNYNRLPHYHQMLHHKQRQFRYTLIDLEPHQNKVIVRLNKHLFTKEEMITIKLIYGGI